MSKKMEQCSCLGKNPDCFRCGGWGYRKKHIVASPTKIRRIGGSKRARKPRNKICPYCTKKVRAIDLHVSKEHDDQWDEYFERAEVKLRLEKNNLKRCQICKIFVKNLDKHLRKKHGNEISQSLKERIMTISNHVDKVKEDLRRGAFTSEASVSQGILLPFLHELGWTIFDTSVVIPEYSLEGRRVDFALCHPAKKPTVFIEVKKVGLARGADRQLFEYAFHYGVPMAILTDGQEWSFYLPGEQGRYDERRVYKLDLLERSTEGASRRLNRYLNYKSVCSGDALKAARSDYLNVARGREIEVTLHGAWTALLEERDSLLLDLLADKVEDLCGYKPDLDTCSEFLEKKINSSEPTKRLQPVDVSIKRPINKCTKRFGTVLTRSVKHFTFTYKEVKYEARSAREVMTKVFQLLSEEDDGFLDRFIALKHGKKRRYLSRERSELYPCFLQPKNDPLL